MLSAAQADALIREHTAPLTPQLLPLKEALGRVLRQSVHAERDQPPFDRVAMDGIALDSRAGTRRLTVQGTQMAGDPPLTLASSGACIEVMTGAMLPQGCDCVVPVEEISIQGGAAVISDTLPLRPHLNVHPRGTDSRKGDLLLSPGVRLRGAELAIVASAGLAQVTVSRAPRIAVISTGSELVEPGQPILDHQVRRSNTYALLAQLAGHGHAHLVEEHLRDDAGELERRLRHHVDTCDVLVLSGGVSMGKLDLVPGVLESLGVRAVFHKVAQRPGRPLWFGVAPSGARVFGLPGNPVSTSVCLTRYVLPALTLAQGMSQAPVPAVALAGTAVPSASLTSFLPCRLELDGESRLWAVLKPTHSSGDFVALLGTDGFVEIPAGTAPLARGTLVSLYRW